MWAADDPFGRGRARSCAWLGGLAVHEASRLVEQTRANNELLTHQEAAAAARAVVEERLRLAREIHDAIGHSLTVVALQAGAARRLAAADPDRAREVMRTVAAAARSGVASLALDEDGADLAALVERVRATGLVVDADLTDEPARPGPAADRVPHRAGGADQRAPARSRRTRASHRAPVGGRVEVVGRELGADGCRLRARAPAAV